MLKIAMTPIYDDVDEEDEGNTLIMTTGFVEILQFK